MNTKIFFSWLITIMLAVNALGQTTLPQVVAASPTAAALQKFTDYPVSLNTGLPDIGVPIYTIQSHGITVPIELKYHASGIRYDDVSRNVGIGWTLFAGGMITRMQMGNADIPGYGFYKSVGDINPASDGTNIHDDNHELINVLKGNQDSEYDIFNYSFLNYSGKFFFPGTTDPVFTPRRNFKITEGNSVSSYIFKLLDEDGISYEFGNGEIEQPSASTTTANLLLKEIISADKSDTVRFKYTGVAVFATDNVPLYQRFVIDDQVSVYDHLIRSLGTPTEAGIPAVFSNHYFEGYSYCRLDNITFKAGKVTFDYNASNQLTKISVYNNADVLPVKIVSLTQTLYSTYYKLDEVKFEDPAATNSYSYKFEYNGTPYGKKSGLDYWGYYNGDPEPGSYVPKFLIDMDNTTLPLPPGTANREPNEEAMLRGSLTKIIYPTGGYSIFNFGAHRYDHGKIAGGLRINSIVNYDAAGVSFGQKWYKYGENESGDGDIYKPVEQADYFYTDLYARSDANEQIIPFDYTYRKRTFVAFPAFSNLTQGSSVTYRYVTEYTGDGTNATGKTLYSYESIPDNFLGPRINSPLPIVYRENSWKSGKLLAKEVYKNSPGGYQLISSVNNTYQDLHNQDYQCLKVMRYLDWPDVEYMNTRIQNHDNIIETFSDPGSYPVSTLGLYSPYSYSDYLLPTGQRVLSNSVETTDGVIRATSYTYDGTYDKPLSVTVTQSDNTSNITQYNYPFNEPDPVYSRMVAANILNPVIEQSEYKNSTSNFLQSTKTDYAIWNGNSNQIYPLVASTKKGAGAYNPRLQYWGYDNKGNIQSVSKVAGTKINYIWGYRGQYPIAQIANGDYNVIIAILGGQAAVDNFRDMAAPTDAQIKAFLAPLRNPANFSGAQVTTYTYKPLVGITSMTDVKGATTHYEYDSFQRLQTVRDQNGQIIKSYVYHYKQ